MATAKLSEIIRRSVAGEVEGYDKAELIAAKVEDQSYSTQVLRSSFDSPLLPDTRIAFDDFTAIFDGEIDSDGSLAFFGVPGLVDNGFAFNSPLLTHFYGSISDSVINVLGIHGLGAHEYDCPEVQALADFAVEKEISLVDWRRAVILRPDDEEFFQFFDDVTGHFDEGAKV